MIQAIALNMIGRIIISKPRTESGHVELKPTPGRQTRPGDLRFCSKLLCAARNHFTSATFFPTVRPLSPAQMVHLFQNSGFDASVADERTDDWTHERTDGRTNTSAPHISLSRAPFPHLKLPFFEQFQKRFRPRSWNRMFARVFSSTIIKTPDGVRTRGTEVQCTCSAAY